MSDTLVLGSGGIKGFSLVGLCKYLDSKGIVNNIYTYIGCSVGSLLCFALICGYNISNLLNEFLNKGYEDIIETSTLENIVSKFGLFDKTKLREQLCEILTKCFDLADPELITFKQLNELTNKQFYVITSNIDTYEVKEFGTTITPNDSCIEAIVASCSIPIVFQGSEIPDGFLVDGAIVDPIGLKVAFKYSVPGCNIYSGFFSFKGTMLKILNAAQGKRDRSKLIELWDKAESEYPQPLEHSRASTSSLITNILSHGQRLYKSVMESLIENYVFRHIYENDGRYNMFLFPLPNLNIGFGSSVEAKVKLYFIGSDISSKIGDGYGI